MSERGTKAVQMVKSRTNNVGNADTGWTFAIQTVRSSLSGPAAKTDDDG